MSTRTADNLDELRAVLVALTPAQSIAADALATGSTHAEAAERAGVTRETVTIWTNHHPGFREALDRYRHALAAELADAARSLRRKALVVVDHALDDGDVRAAIAVLKIVPIIETGPPVIAAEVLTDEVRRRADTRPRPLAPRDHSGRISGAVDIDSLIYDTATERFEANQRAGLELLAAAVAPTLAAEAPTGENRP